MAWLTLPKLVGRCPVRRCTQLMEVIMAKTTAQSNAVCWFEIYVADLARAKSFYQAVLKRPMDELATHEGGDMQMCSFTMGKNASGAAGALVKSTHMKPGTGGTLIYFSCADCAVEAARVVPHGGKVLKPKTGIGEYGFIAIVEDTEGNTIGLHSQE